MIEIRNIMAYSNFPFWFLKWCRNANTWGFLIHAGIYISLRYYFPLDWVQCTMKCFICKILFKWTFRQKLSQGTHFEYLKEKKWTLIWTRKYVVCLALTVWNSCVYVCVFVPVKMCFQMETHLNMACTCA